MGEARGIRDPNVHAWWRGPEKVKKLLIKNLDIFVYEYMCCYAAYVYMYYYL